MGLKPPTPKRGKKQPSLVKGQPDVPNLAASTPDDTVDPLTLFHPVTASWLRAVFEKPTTPQQLGWTRWVAAATGRPPRTCPGENQGRVIPTARTSSDAFGNGSKIAGIGASQRKRKETSSHAI